MTAGGAEKVALNIMKGIKDTRKFRIILAIELETEGMQFSNGNEYYFCTSPGYNLSLNPASRYFISIYLMST